MEVAGLERGVEVARVVGAQPLVRDAGGLERRPALLLEPVLPQREPRDADRLPDARARLFLQVEPDRARAAREPRVPLDTAVCRTREARVAAGAGAHVARRVLLDQRHVPAAQRQLPRGGGAEDSRTDDGGAAHCPMYTASARNPAAVAAARDDARAGHASSAARNEPTNRASSADPCSAASTARDPTTMPSVRSAASRACAGVEMPKPACSGSCRDGACPGSERSEGRSEISARTRRTRDGDEVEPAVARVCREAQTLVGRRRRRQLHSTQLWAHVGREVRDDERGRAGRARVGFEPLPAVGVEDRRVGHRDQRHVHTSSCLGQHLEAAAGAHAGRERPLAGAADHGPVRERVGEREAELDHVGAGFDRCLRELGRLGHRHQVDDERLHSPASSE